MSQLPTRLIFRATRPLQHHHDARLFFQACRSITNAPPKRRTTIVRSSPAATATSSPGRTPVRSFSSTHPTAATAVLQNPRVDEDGADMQIEISERAAKRLKQITSAPPKKNTLTPSPSTQDGHLRVTVTSGGCHGFQYLMSLEDASKIDQEEDTVFAVEPESDGAEGIAKVVMDLPSLELLKGSTVDFTTELIGSQFKIVGNPRATSSCGCGTSFDIQ